MTYQPHLQLVLLDSDEQKLRLSKLRRAMHARGIDCGLVTGNSNKYYLTGRVFAGYILVTPDTVTYYVKRPVEMEGTGIVYIRKHEDINVPHTQVALETEELSYLTTLRLCKVFKQQSAPDLSECLAEARAVKTPLEINLLMQSGMKQAKVYSTIPSLYKNGMTDLQLQIEIERASRLEGCLGQFRIAGDSMELFMGNVLAGDNADAPSPYDFAMGGAGIDPSIPVGADNTLIRPGMAVMVDVNGNYTGYMTDMTRIFCLDHVSDEALRAHRCSMRIHRTLAEQATPGTKASDLYESAMAIVEEDGLKNYFMGHRQHAGFIGHGVGIEINEHPVIAPRSRDIIAENNVIALEPKFVIPGCGAVGNENTYVVRPDGMECITLCNENIIDLNPTYRQYQ